MSHGVEHRRRRRECVIRELLIADSDRRLRLSSSIQEYSQSKESYYIPTYIQILLSSTNLRSCLEKKGGKRLIHTWVQYILPSMSIFRHATHLSLDKHLCFQWQLRFGPHCGFKKSHDKLGNVETKCKLIALAGENFDNF